MTRHEDLTQQFSTWGDKLLQHTDVLYGIQNRRKFNPITVQLAPCEVCDSDCAFCSVAERPLRSAMPFATIKRALDDFKKLGAKSLEITGGGNPMLYRDKLVGADINTIIEYAWGLGYDVGIITNAHDLGPISAANYDKINWIRISLIKLDEGKEPPDYELRGFPQSKVGFSYIIYDECESTPRLGKHRPGTTPETIRKMANLLNIYPDVKFVRIAGNCLIKGNNAEVRQKWRPIIDEIDRLGKFFVKDIGEDDSPYDHGCYVGMVRPYVAPDPHGNGYYVYACTSHVLQKRTYDRDYALCSVEDVLVAWDRMNERFKQTGSPYEIKFNGGKNWCDTCQFCYYKFNNKLLHTVANDMPDKNFA